MPLVCSKRFQTVPENSDIRKTRHGRRAICDNMGKSLETLEHTGAALMPPE